MKNERILARGDAAALTPRRKRRPISGPEVAGTAAGVATAAVPAPSREAAIADRIERSRAAAAAADAARGDAPSPPAAGDGRALRTAGTYATAIRRALAPALPALVVLGALACLVGAAQGYPCRGRDPTADQSFAVPGTDIVGTIHGWLSNCYDVTYQCGSTPSRTCSGSGANQRCTTSYTPLYCTATYTNRAPAQYVADFARLAQSCGAMMTQLAAHLGVQRIPGDAEHGHWVRVAASAWNTTAGLDPIVACLHRI